MDSPGQHVVRRRAASSNSGNTALPPRFKSDGSPSPFASNAKSLQTGETRFPRSTQTVSLGWEEGEDALSQHTSSLRIELAECVETKTVTTTTTTKRSYPPLRVRQRPLASLDAKEYPLASKAPPPELTDLSFEFDGQLMEDLQENDRHTPVQEVRHFTSPKQ
jgi:F-box and WD-40 domain protein CDC4